MKSSIILCALLIAGHLAAQPLKPLDPKTAHTKYEFALRADRAPFRFQVAIDGEGAVTGVAVYRRGQSDAFQTLSTRKDDINDS